MKDKVLTYEEFKKECEYYFYTILPRSIVLEDVKFQDLESWYNCSFFYDNEKCFLTYGQDHDSNYWWALRFSSSRGDKMGIGKTISGACGGVFKQEIERLEK